MNDQTLSGRYRIEDRCGSGGFAVVYRGWDLLLERTVAIKVLAEHLSDDERFVARFRLEALAAAKLIHPNIVQVYDAGLDGGRHYLVMYYVDGASCEDLLKEGRPTRWEAVEIVSQAAVGLDYMHERGIVHRDVKPGNLMVAKEDGLTVMVGDFGIARAMDQVRIGGVFGTGGYLCPEARWGEEATPLFDMYALGVVAHRLLVGGFPVRNRNGGIAIDAERLADPELRGLLELVEQAIHDDPRERLAGCRTFADELRGTLAA